MFGVYACLKRVLLLVDLIPTQISIKGYRIPFLISPHRFQARQIDLLRKLKPIENGFDLIRVGGHGDGSYLITDDLDGIRYCFSPGSGGNARFEIDLYNRFQIKSFILDEEGAKPSNLTMGQVFRVGLLGASDKGKKIDLETWILESTGACEDLLLQMDIEGAEWEILNSVTEKTLQRFRIIVVEFHDFQAINHPRFFMTVMQPVFEKLFSSFDLVYARAHNGCGEIQIGTFTFPRVVELTFHAISRSKLATSLDKSQPEYRSLPHPLDERVDPLKPPLAMILP